MIAKIRLKNFKRFRDLTLPTANLTVLTGTNGAGKSTVLQSLLLARQIARQPNRTHVELNGVGSLDLGGPDDIIHREASEELASVEVRDTHGKHWLWSFGAKESSDSRTLNAIVVERPGDYNGILARSAPEFCYLSAERLGPRDVLAASAARLEELDVGPRGEFVAQVLASFDRSRISTGRADNLSPETQLFGLLSQTESWMAKIVRPIQIEAEWFPNTSVTRLRFKTPGLTAEWTRAPNAGFGISYALPVVVAALRAADGGLLLVENPEAHLHPAGQSKIGGFLARIAADGVQVFLETHSDHVLNGIRVAVAEGSAALSPEETAIHFFRAEDEDGPDLYSIELKRTGQLSAWPIGFFDQVQVDLAALVSKQRNNT